MGSGKLILLAEAKYGLSAFTKEILFDFDNFNDMNNKEKELVQLSNCFPYDEMSYNLKTGGQSEYFSNTNQISKTQSICKKDFWNNLTEYEYSEICKNISVGRKNMFKNETPEQKQKRIDKHIIAWSNMPLEKIEKISYDAKLRWDKKSDEEKIKFSKLKSEQMAGENNPMYGINVETLLTLDEIQKKRFKQKQTWKNKSQNEIDEMIAKQQKTMKNKGEKELKKIYDHHSKMLQGKKKMYLPDNKKDFKYVSPLYFQDFLNMGYVFADKTFR